MASHDRIAADDGDKGGTDPKDRPDTVPPGVDGLNAVEEVYGPAPQAPPDDPANPGQDHIGQEPGGGVVRRLLSALADSTPAFREPSQPPTGAGRSRRLLAALADSYRPGQRSSSAADPAAAGGARPVDRTAAAPQPGVDELPPDGQAPR
jgi:hypothetical protein